MPEQYLAMVYLFSRLALNKSSVKYQAFQCSLYNVVYTNSYAYIILRTSYICDDFFAVCRREFVLHGLPVCKSRFTTECSYFFVVLRFRPPADIAWPCSSIKCAYARIESVYRNPICVFLALNYLFIYLIDGLPIYVLTYSILSWYVYSMSFQGSFRF